MSGTGIYITTNSGRIREATSGEVAYLNNRKNQAAAIRSKIAELKRQKDIVDDFSIGLSLKTDWKSSVEEYAIKGRKFEMLYDEVTMFIEDAQRTLLYQKEEASGWLQDEINRLNGELSEYSGTVLFPD